MPLLILIPTLMPTTPLGTAKEIEEAWRRTLGQGGKWLVLAMRDYTLIDPITTLILILIFMPLLMPLLTPLLMPPNPNPNAHHPPGTAKEIEEAWRRTLGQGGKWLIFGMSESDRGILEGPNSEAIQAAMTAQFPNCFFGRRQHGFHHSTVHDHWVIVQRGDAGKRTWWW
jgi:hypothetical protein